jgi:hypothetical protein
MKNIKQKQELSFEYSGDTISAVVELVEENKVTIKANINGVNTKLSIKKDVFNKKVQNQQINLI